MSMENIINKIKEKNNETSKKLEDLKEILNDYFGKENVEISLNTDDKDDGCLYNILIHFPEVKVTNENDKSILLNHLWVKIKLTAVLTIIGTFTINKSEYQLSHFMHKYMFSHVHRIDYARLKEFKVPCLGTGPIKNTIASLQLEYTHSLWQLFCVELDKYIHTESESGVPYIYLTDVTGERSYSILYIRDKVSPTNYKFNAVKNYFMSPLYKDFIKDFISSNKLKFNFTNGNYGIAMSYVDLVLIISNHFIGWYNKNKSKVISKEYLYDNKILVPVNIRNSLTIEVLSNSILPNMNRYTFYEGTPLFDFKGNTIKLHIVDNCKNSSNKHPLILNPLIIDMLITRILTIINYKYNKNGINTQTICII